MLSQPGRDDAGCVVKLGRRFLLDLVELCPAKAESHPSLTESCMQGAEKFPDTWCDFGCAVQVPCPPPPQMPAIHPGAETSAQRTAQLHATGQASCTHVLSHLTSMAVMGISRKQLSWQL